MNSTEPLTEEQLKSQLELPERGEPVDSTLSQRVATGTATPQELKSYHLQARERDRERLEARAKRSEHFAEMEPAELNDTENQLSRELDKVSDEMRSIAPLSPLFRERRKYKLQIADALEDVKAGRERRAFNDRRADLERRSEERKQLDAAKNFPLSSDDANHAINSEVPGKEEPTLDEQNPNLDSRAILKGGQIRTIQGDQVVHSATPTAHEAVHGQ